MGLLAARSLLDSSIADLVFRGQHSCALLGRLPTGWLVEDSQSMVSSLIEKIAGLFAARPCRAGSGAQAGQGRKRGESGEPG